ncbi:MAG: radical SAM protein [Nitrospirae bacterium]|nr:radical SAM protein [Nitrospirota bacterium]
MNHCGEFHIEIETTNLCNTRCLHCPHEEVTRPSGKMDWVTYQTIMDNLMTVSPIISVEYGGMGEPMLNPLIYQFIKYVSSKAKTSVTTNASALTHKNIQRLIDAGLSNLTISFNGSDKATYELMMGGLSFERAQRNLCTVVEVSRGTELRVSANVSVTRQTEKSLNRIKTYLEEIGINSISFSMAHNRAGFIKDQTICNTPMPTIDKHRCDIFGMTLFVAWTGEVLSCCHDLTGKNVLGNLMSESIDTILQRKKCVADAGVNYVIC